MNGVREGLLVPVCKSYLRIATSLGHTSFTAMHMHTYHTSINAEKSYKRGYHHVRGGVSNTALEAAFIRHVTLEIERRRSVKVKVKAGWATEEKMRDVSKLTPFLAQNIL